MNFSKFTIITEEGDPNADLRVRRTQDLSKGDPHQVNLNKGQEPDVMSAEEVRKANEDRPKLADPIPDQLIERYGGRIGDVWWFAKGRNGPDGDSTIGVEVDGIRKTFGGYVWNDWWYFQKTVHKTEDPNQPNKCYWYRKRKIPDPLNPDEFETVEEYVGSKLKDPDSGLPIDVPQELRHEKKDLCPDSDGSEGESTPSA